MGSATQCARGFSGSAQTARSCSPWGPARALRFQTLPPGSRWNPWSQPPLHAQPLLLSRPPLRAHPQLQARPPLPVSASAPCAASAPCSPPTPRIGLRSRSQPPLHSQPPLPAHRLSALPLKVCESVSAASLRAPRGCRRVCPGHKAGRARLPRKKPRAPGPGAAPPCPAGGGPRGHAGVGYAFPGKVGRLGTLLQSTSPPGHAFTTVTSRSFSDSAPLSPLFITSSETLCYLAASSFYQECGLLERNGLWS